MPGERIEQRLRLRAEQPPAATTLVVRGGRDTPDKLRAHVQRTARAWSLDGQPMLGISVFAVLGEPLDDLLRRRFATFRTIYLPTAGRLVTTDSSCCPPRSAPSSVAQRSEADHGKRPAGDSLSAADLSLTRLTATQASPAEHAAITRGHQAIEDRLHRVRDMDYDEDRSQVRTASAARVMATLRNLAITILRLAGHASIAAALRHQPAGPTGHYERS